MSSLKPGCGGHTWSVSAPTPACWSAVGCWSAPADVHPHASFAAEHLGKAHGKAEAWYIVEGGEIHLGLKQDITGDDLKSLVMSQDVDTILNLLHRVLVYPGDVVMCRLAFCTRSMKVCSWSSCKSPRTCRSCWSDGTFDLDGECDVHLGLGFDLALEAVECRSRSGEEIRQLIRPAGLGPPSCRKRQTRTSG
jgi:mannose-6-phosphate isomerase